MSEEIIIDGVNVSECKHFKYDGIKKPICRSGGCRGVYKNCLCEGNDDCYFKQLKRLQAENEELKKEYKELKEQEEKIHQGWWSQCRVIEKQEIEIKENLHYLACMTEQRNKLKIALEEIKNIANVIINGQHITDDIEGHLKDIVKNHILTKISEVLDERN